MQSQTSFEYDIALSFAGEDRNYVESIANLLINRQVRIFYDKHEQSNLWGKDLYQHLQSIYKDKARYCLIFCSQHYAEKLWTKHELRQAQARAFEENSEYILPLRLDNTNIPGINGTTGYVDSKSFSIEEIAELIHQKIQSSLRKVQNSDNSGFLALDNLGQRLRAGYSEDRVKAAKEAEKLGINAMPLIPLLKKCLKDSSGPVRLAASRALWEIGTDEAKDAVWKYEDR
jgi:hypothetical protein